MNEATCCQNLTLLVRTAQIRIQLRMEVNTNTRNKSIEFSLQFAGTVLGIARCREFTDIYRLRNLSSESVVVSFFHELIRPTTLQRCLQETSLGSEFKLLMIFHNSRQYCSLNGSVISQQRRHSKTGHTLHSRRNR